MRQAPRVDVACLSLRTGCDDDRMTVDGAAGIYVIVVVRVILRGVVLFVQHQASRQLLEVRNGADPCNVVIVAAVSFAFGGHLVGMITTQVSSSLLPMVGRTSR